ncbi:hypothetical protein GN956_G8011, partial [Arapaima gigas]
LCPEYTKRVYQGVRVKHTVKDLLAEKRSRQSSAPKYNVRTNPSQPAFVPLPAPHMVPSCYSLKRPFISGTEFSSPQCQNKAPTVETYSLPLENKLLSCDPPSTTNYSTFKDSYYPDPLGDYRSSGYPAAASALFAPSLSSLLPTYSGDPTHVFLRESWEQPEADPGTQVEGFAEVLTLVPTPSTSGMSTSESGSPSQCRASTRNTDVPSPQLYPLQPLEEGQYPASYLHHHSYPGTAHPSASNDHTSRMLPLSTEEPDSTSSMLANTQCWTSDDNGNSWSLYGFRKAF